MRIASALSERFQMHVSKPELRQWRTRARKAGFRSLASWLRYVANNAANKPDRSTRDGVGDY